MEMLSHHSIAPKTGTLEKVLHIFAHVKHHEQSTLIFDEQETSLR
jgi:hypothetical protein